MNSCGIELQKQQDRVDELSAQLTDFLQETDQKIRKNYAAFEAQVRDRMEKELKDVSTAYRRVAAVLEGSFRTSIGEHVEQILDTPLHEALRALPLSEYMEPPVIEKIGVSFSGEPVYYVNGIWTRRDTAVEAAEFLSEQLQRPVNLVYNPSELNPPEYSTGTPGVFGDVAEAALDVIWPLLICTMPQDQEPELSNGRLQHNPSTRQFTHVFFHAKKPMSVVSHSQGCIIVRNACFTLGLLGKQDWVRQHLAWVAGRNPADRRRNLAQT